MEIEHGWISLEAAFAVLGDDVKIGDFLMAAEGLTDKHGNVVLVARESVWQYIASFDEIGLPRWPDP